MSVINITLSVLSDALKKNTDLDGKLLKTKKKLQQSLAFAEDLVREQEGLLAQLHEKQKENMVMVTQFGSLKKKLKVKCTYKYIRLRLVV